MGPSRAAGLFLEKNPGAEKFRVTLYGSLALTGKGHGTDSAILKVIDRPDAVEIVWKPDISLPRHPNGMLFEAFVQGNTVDSWEVYSVGGGALWDELGTFDDGNLYPETSMAEVMKWCLDEGCTFVDYVEKNYPQFVDHIPTAVSPMIATARAIKAKDKKARVVFVGPCTAKKVEMKRESLKDAVDIVITFEELQAIFDAREIELTSLEPRMAGEASSFGRNFAGTGGVTESVAHTLELSGLDLDVKAVRCNGIDECIKAMKMASFGKLDANFIEGMACKHGCTGGAASLLHDAKGIEMINRYGKESKTDNPLEILEKYPIDNINMERFNHED